jgi:hypothetical protein
LGCAARDKALGAGKTPDWAGKKNIWASSHPKMILGSFQPSQSKRINFEGVLPADRNHKREEKQMPLISKVLEIVAREFRLEDYVAAAVEN